MQMSRNRASNYPRSSVNKPLNLFFGVLAPDPRHCLVNRKCTNEYKWYIRMHTVQVNTHCVELRFQLQPVPFSHDELWDVEVLVHASGRVSMCFTISPSRHARAKCCQLVKDEFRSCTSLELLSDDLIWRDDVDNATPASPGTWVLRYQHPALRPLRHVTASWHSFIILLAVQDLPRL